MNKAIKIAAIWALIYIVLKISVMLLGYHHEPYSLFVGFAINSMCLLLAIAISIISNFNRLKHNGVSLIVDIKTGMKTGVFYSLIIATFLFSYYKWIDPDYAKIITEKRIEYAESISMESIEDKMNEDPDGYANQSAKDVRDQEIDNTKFFLDPKKVFPITLLSLIVISILYSFMVTGFNRLILSKLG